MKAYPTKYEVYEDNECTELMAKFTAFDEETFEVKIDNKLISSKDLRELARLLEIAEEQLKEGIKI